MIDPSTPLCERCGYPIQGLPESGNCPECGRPVADSLPSRRIGTPAQRSRRPSALAATWWMAIAHPLRTLSIVTSDPPRIGPVLLVAAWPMAVALAMAMLLALELRHVGQAGRSGPLLAMPAAVVLGTLASVVLTPVLAGVLWLLTWIETRGMVLIGAQRGLRMHVQLARAITAHGSAWWLLCGAGAACTWPWLASAWTSARGDPGPNTMDAFLRLGETGRLLTMAAGLLLAVAGFLGFECFAWLGLRRCGYANAPGRRDAGNTSAVSHG